MSILSVDTIQPIGSGSTVTLNAAKIVVGTGITFESNGQAIYAGIITATSFSGTASNASGATGDFSIADKIIHTGDTNTALRFPAADTITAETGGSERARIDSSGRLLLGTTTEGTGSGDDLTISNSGNMGLTLRSTDSNYCNIYFSDATSGTAEYEGYMSYNHATNSLEFATSHTERLRIASNGHVGINRTSPTRKLHVAADNDLTSFTGTSYGIIAIENSQYDSGDYNAIDFTYSGSNNPVARIAAKITGGGSSLHFGTSNNYSSGITNEALTITSTGNLEKRGGGSYFAYNSSGYYAKQDNYDSTGGKSYWYDGGSGNNNIVASIDGQTGNLMSKGNLRILTAGKGIDFSAAADDSTNLAETVDSSILDDYEEGQFTPAVQFDSGGGSISYGTRYGRYRKVGNMVHITYYMEIASGVSSSDFFARLSLPFNGYGGAVGHQDARIRQWNTGVSDWFVSLGGSAPVFFMNNGNGSGANYARGDDINGYKLSGQYTLYT